MNYVPPNNHIMCSGMRIQTINSVMMYLIVFDNHPSDSTKVEAKILMVYIIISEDAPITTIVVKTSSTYTRKTSFFISQIRYFWIYNISSSCCILFNRNKWSRVSRYRYISFASSWIMSCSVSYRIVSSCYLSKVLLTRAKFRKH